MKQLWLLLSSAISFLLPPMAHASSCCGGGGSVSALMNGEQQSKISFSYDYKSLVVDQVDPSGIWRRNDEHQSLEVFELTAATLLSDRWQAGASLGVSRRGLNGSQYSHLGDFRAVIGYEFLPDWEYHPIQPNGLLFAELLVPTGGSHYESQMGGLDTAGNGFFAASAGILLRKSHERWDGMLSAKLRRSFSQQFESSFIRGRAEGTWAGSADLGIGFTVWDTRLGGSIAWDVTEAIPVNYGGVSDPGAVSRLATAALSLTSPLNKEWTATLTYSDQTWFGAPTNTALGRGIAILLEKQWLR